MNILWIKDGKLGHEKQVRALIDEIANTIDINLTELTTGSKTNNIIEFISFGLIKNNKTKEEITKSYDLIIGAGTNAHLKMANLSKTQSSAKIVSILAPHFLLRNKFHFICLPKHDSYKKFDQSKILYFEGSLSKVFDTGVDDKTGMIAVGGGNKHYKFNPISLIGQINYMVSLYPTKQWSVYNSRRTSKEMNDHLENLQNQFSNVSFIKITNKNSQEMYAKSIRTASIKLVTSDSVNMVYECMSSSGKTVLLNMEPKKNNKIVKNINSLIHDRRIGYIESSKLADGLSSFSLKVQNEHMDILREVEKLSFRLIKKIN